MYIPDKISFLNRRTFHLQKKNGRLLLLFPQRKNQLHFQKYRQRKLTTYVDFFR